MIADLNWGGKIRCHMDGVEKDWPRARWKVGCSSHVCPRIAPACPGIAPCIENMPAMFSYPHRPKSGQITCYLKRTYHVLTTLLRQPALPGAETALAAPPCLRRVSRNHLYPQFAQRSSHLRQAMRIHFPAHLRRQPEMAPPIAVQ